MSFFNELKRRNVFRAGFAYALVGWVIAQVTDLALENFGAPEWVKSDLGHPPLRFHINIALLDS